MPALVIGPPVNDRPVEPPEASTDETVPETQVPFTAKHPVLTFTPLVNVDVALPETESCDVEAIPRTARAPLNVDVAVVDVAVIQATDGEVEDVNVFVPPLEYIQPWPKDVAPVPPDPTPTVERETAPFAYDRGELNVVVAVQVGTPPRRARTLPGLPADVVANWLVPLP